MTLCELHPYFGPAYIATHAAYEVMMAITTLLAFRNQEPVTDYLVHLKLLHMSSAEMIRPAAADAFAVIAVNVLLSPVAPACERREAVLVGDSSEDLLAQSGTGQTRFVSPVEDPKKIEDLLEPTRRSM